MYPAIQPPDHVPCLYSPNADPVTILLTVIASETPIGETAEVPAEIVEMLGWWFPKLRA